MKKLKVLFLAALLVSPSAFAMDESDVPPPPMPEYMKKHQVKMEVQDTSISEPELESSDEENSESVEEVADRDTASTPAESFEGQSAESIKQEFLQVGDEESELSEDEPVQQKVMEGSISEVSDEEMNEAPKTMYEDPIAPPPIEEVSAVDESTGEFEQANISPDQSEKVKNDFQSDVGNKVAEPEQAPVNPEALAEVEETLEEAEQEAEAIAAGARQPSAKAPFKSGMYKFAEECKMYKEPRSFSDQAGSIPPGRKLWIDSHNENWLKAYKKSGTVYISTDCLK